MEVVIITSTIIMRTSSMVKNPGIMLYSLCLKFIYYI
jgi:hypothetical protein